METIFPELADSEDERIRKWLIAQLKIKIGDSATLDNMIYKAITWLEKQGNHEASSLFTFDDVLTIQCAMTNAKETDKELYNALRSLHDKVHDTYHNEKQGMQKHIAWNEEDEENFNKALWYVRHPRQDVLKDTMLVEWMKSLRDRLQH